VSLASSGRHKQFFGGVKVPPSGVALHGVEQSDPTAAPAAQASASDGHDRTDSEGSKFSYPNVVTRTQYSHEDRYRPASHGLFPWLCPLSSYSPTTAEAGHRLRGRAPLDLSGGSAAGWRGVNPGLGPVMDTWAANPHEVRDIIGHVSSQPKCHSLHVSSHNPVQRNLKGEIPVRTLRPLARIGLALVFSLILCLPMSTSQADDDVPFSINVLLTNAHVLPNSGNSVVRAFILTDSANPNCLVSLGESNNAVAGTVAFCGARQPSLYGGRPGAMITVFFPGPVVVNLVLTVTVHQNGARGYGQPVACLPADGC
jgi:hypothetical protein